MENFRLDYRMANENKIGTFTVYTQYHHNLYCSFKILNDDGYLFTLVPTDDLFTDFQLSDRDRYLNQDIDFGILHRVKMAIINHFL